MAIIQIGVQINGAPIHVDTDDLTDAEYAVYVSLNKVSPVAARKFLRETL